MYGGERRPWIRSSCHVTRVVLLTRVVCMGSSHFHGLCGCLYSEADCLFKALMFVTRLHTLCVTGWDGGA